MTLVGDIISYIKSELSEGGGNKFQGIDLDQLQQSLRPTVTPSGYINPPPILDGAVSSPNNSIQLNKLLFKQNTAGLVGNELIRFKEISSEATTTTPTINQVLVRIIKNDVNHTGSDSSNSHETTATNITVLSLAWNPDIIIDLSHYNDTDNIILSSATLTGNGPNLQLTWQIEILYKPTR